MSRSSTGRDSEGGGLDKGVKTDVCKAPTPKCSLPPKISQSLELKMLPRNCNV